MNDSIQTSFDFDLHFKRLFDYPNNFSLIGSMLIFIQNTIILIFNLWSNSFIFLPFVGVIVKSLSSIFTFICAHVFLESMKQLMSHCEINATKNFCDECTGRLAFYLYIILTFYILFILPVNSIKFIFNPWHNYWFFGLTWVPQIIKNSLLGHKNTSIMRYVIWHTCYILYIPISLSYLN